MVKPANAPPLRTRAAATPKYSHRLGSLGGFGSTSELMIKVGAAEMTGRLATAKKQSFAKPRTRGRAARIRVAEDIAITEGQWKEGGKKERKRQERPEGYQRGIFEERDDKKRERKGRYELGGRLSWIGGRESRKMDGNDEVVTTPSKGSAAAAALLSSGWRRNRNN